MSGSGLRKNRYVKSEMHNENKTVPAVLLAGWETQSKQANDTFSILAPLRSTDRLSRIALFSSEKIDDVHHDEAGERRRGSKRSDRCSLDSNFLAPCDQLARKSNYRAKEFVTFGLHDCSQNIKNNECRRTVTLD